MKQPIQKKLFFIILTAVLIMGVLISFSVHQKYPWLPDYVIGSLKPNPVDQVTGVKHIMFLYVDHFEPHDQETMDRWMTYYPQVAQMHRDSDGKMPQHSWFWHFDHSDDTEKRLFLNQLSQLAYDEFGEMEMHLHHFNDNEASLTEKLRHSIRLSQEAGAFITAETKPRTAFAFIHGLWGLDNSRGAGACGVNNELIILRRLGCFADFTNPSWGPMHSSLVNTLYYATDDPKKPKSYDRGRPMKVGMPGVGDLLMFTGQSVATFSKFKFRYDHGEISADELPTPERIDRWIKKGVHVTGRPEWIFVKVFSHGAIAADHEAVLGKWRDDMHTYLEEHYNDGVSYQLHYVTAREAYNIAKAAESGASGNPNQYRDYLIPPYLNRFMKASIPYEMISMDEHQAVMRLQAPAGSRVDVTFRTPSVSIFGDSQAARISEGNPGETKVDLVTQGEGVVGFQFEGLPK